MDAHTQVQFFKKSCQVQVTEQGKTRSLRWSVGGWQARDLQNPQFFQFVEDATGED
jgi:hypothetical protein